MLTPEQNEHALYLEWRDAYTKLARPPALVPAQAIMSAGQLFKSQPLPHQVRKELMAFLETADWTVDIQWQAFNNFTEGFLNRDKALLKAAHRAGITQRMALSYALLLDATGRKTNEKRLYQCVRTWERRVPENIKDVSNTVSELIRVWGGDARAEQWLSVLSLDKEWNNNALSLESRDCVNLTAIIEFAFNGKPLRPQLAQSDLPCDLSDFNA